MLKLETKNFYVEIDTLKSYGYFEHNTLGDDLGGGLWFDGNTLVDYDGVFELPNEVKNILEMNKFKVED